MAARSETVDTVVAVFKKFPELKNFLSTPDRPVTLEEFKEFWEACSNEEKEDFIMDTLPVIQNHNLSSK